MILAINSTTVDSIMQIYAGKAHPYGLLSKDQINIITNKISSELWFGPREELETKPQFRQIIPYVIIGNNNGRVMIYQRSSSQGDARLRNLYSIGLGGHIRIQDIKPHMVDNGPFININQLLIASMKRELSEELLIPISEISIENISIIGFISLGTPFSHNSGNSIHDVNSVHFGFIYYYKNANIKIPETNSDDMRKFEFVNLSDVLSTFNTNNNELEAWSIASINLLKEKANVK
jgi:predicted NUDIX family phosphoesterase